MKKRTNKKGQKLYLGVSLFCLFGAFIGITEKSLLMTLFYAILSILLFVLWIKKPITFKESPSVIVNTRTPSASVNKINKNSTKENRANPSSEINVPENSHKIEKFHVTGTSHYQNNIESLGTENYAFELSKKELIEEGYEDDKIYSYNFYPSNVELIEEPDNPYDPNAIKVVIDDVLVGYIKKGSCSHIKKLLHSGKIKKIDADIYGGKYKMLYSEFDDEKDKEVYYIEKDKSDYYVIIEISIEE